MSRHHHFSAILLWRFVCTSARKNVLTVIPLISLSCEARGEKGTKIKRYPDNLLPKTSLEVSRTLLVFRLQLVSIGGQQPFQRMPDDDQLVVSRQHSFYFRQGIVGEPLKGTWRMRLISRYFHRIITWPFPRGHHQNSFPVRARNLIHESVDLEWNKRTTII